MNKPIALIKHKRGCSLFYGESRMNNLQYIRDHNDNPLFVVLPIEEYNRFKEYEAMINDEDESEWDSLPYESGDNDDALIPHEVVMAMIDNNVNLLGAWRIYRNLSQQEVAERTGITQSAISQMERAESKPRKATLTKFAEVYNCEIEQMY